MSKFKTNEEYFQYSKTLAVIPTEDLVRLLLNYKLKFPTQLHRFALKETLYPKVFQTQLYNSYTDELKYRLRGYQDYSLFLLEKLIADYELEFDAARYKEIFFNLLFLNRDLYGLKDVFFQDLEKLKYKYAVDFEKMSYASFMNYFQPLIVEAKGYLDGVNLKILKDVLVHSCTLGDLRSLGEKYDVKIPRRINKTQLIEILVHRFKLSNEQALELNNKSVLELEIYAKENGFKISIDLKKADMVEYILFAKDMVHLDLVKDLHDYRIPKAEDLDAVKFDDSNFVHFEETVVASVLQEEDIVQKAAPKEVVVEKTPIVEPQKPEVVSKPEPIVIPPVIEKQVEPETEELEEVVLLEEIVEAEKVEPIQEEKPEVHEEKETPVVVKPVHQPKAVQPEPKQEAVPEEPKEEPVQPEPKKEPKVQKKQVVKREVLPKEHLVELESTTEVPTFSDDEQALLDDKIEQIIKRYKKSKRRKTFFLVLLWIVLFAIFGFGLIVAYYYFILTPGQLPPFLPF